MPMPCPRVVVTPGEDAVPVETLIRTFEPRGAFLFGTGFWAVTVPFGWALGTLNSTGVRPAVCSAAFASAAGWPRTSGTVV
jgi:hypothetical protein